MKSKISFLCLAATLLLLHEASASARKAAPGWNVSVGRFEIPVLTGKLHNAVLHIRLERLSEEASDTLQGLELSLRGTTDLQDITELGLYGSNPKGMLDEAKPLVTTQQLSPQVYLPLPQGQLADSLSLWVSVRLRPSVDLSHRYNVDCRAIFTGRGKRTLPKHFDRGLRAGVAMRLSGQNGIHTSRIPGLTTSTRGTLVACFDARHDSPRDLQGDIDICVQRSTDGGRTWGPLIKALDMKDYGGLPEKFNGVSDACLLTDEVSGTLYVAGTWMHGVIDRDTGKWIEGLKEESKDWNHQWAKNGSLRGNDLYHSSQFLLAKSTDDGQHWSAPENLTSSLKDPSWTLIANAPGHGITLRDGTLVWPAAGRDSTGRSFSTIVFSRDRGETWKAGRPAHENTTECMAVELNDGSLMLNMRDNINRGLTEGNGRRISVTHDLGITWTEHHTSHKALIEPVCMGSLHKHFFHQGKEKRSILLFSNPDSMTKRCRMTVKVSYDDGETWDEHKKILLDELNSRGYSCITSVDAHTIGILYESSQADLVFQTISLDEFF